MSEDRPMEQRTLGKSGLRVSAMGLGLMSMSGTYGKSDDEQSIRVIHAALDRGVDFLDSSDLYGWGQNETLLGRALKGRLVERGKVRHLGLSEAAPETIRRAHAVHPIAAVQSEYSLLYRQPAEDTIATCRPLGIAFVAYSPIGRGLLSATIKRAADIP